MPDDLAERIANNDFGDADTVTTREMRDKLSEIVGRCAYGGDRFVVKRHGKPLAAIVPHRGHVRRSVRGGPAGFHRVPAGP